MEERKHLAIYGLSWGLLLFASIGWILAIDRLGPIGGPDYWGAVCAIALPYLAICILGNVIAWYAAVWRWPMFAVAAAYWLFMIWLAWVIELDTDAFGALAFVIVHWIVATIVSVVLIAMVLTDRDLDAVYGRARR
ncbi:MAG: hypothetical protein EP335_16210 [Alphaproteobacteria bacterium]|nr:MAG: hypothetical protein EP335_16210 [Alphaproteobacteria bacterium]